MFIYLLDTYWIRTRTYFYYNRQYQGVSRVSRALCFVGYIFHALLFCSILVGMHATGVMFARYSDMRRTAPSTSNIVICSVSYILSLIVIAEFYLPFFIDPMVNFTLLYYKARYILCCGWWCIQGVPCSDGDCPGKKSARYTE